MITNFDVLGLLPMLSLWAMHIPDGVLSATNAGNVLLAAATIITIAGTAIGLRTIDEDRIPRVAILSAAFFALSFISVSFGGPATTHFIFNGLMGIILGWASFPAILVALGIQFFVFGIGGFTTLGLNTLTMAIPAVICYYIFARPVRSRHLTVVWLAGAGAGFIGVVLAIIIHASALAMVGSGFLVTAAPGCIADLVLAPVEGIVTGTIVLFLRRACPELLGAAPLTELPTQ